VAAALTLVSAALFASEPVLGIKGEAHSSIGIYIKDIKADTIVFESEADRTLIPASITKALTSATALTVLKPDFVYETKVYTSGNISNGILHGNLIIKASGDPTLDSEHFPKKKGFVGEIVNAVKAKGISRIEGKITLLRVNPDYQYPEGPIDHWGIDDTPWYYGAGIFDFNWSDNYFGYYPAKGTSNPVVPDLECTIWKKPLSSDLNLIRGVYSNNLILTGAGLTTDKKRRVNTSMPYPFDSFSATLEKELNAAGVTVSGKTVAPENRSLLLTHASPALGDIMKSMMFRSDNMFTEGVLRRFNSTPTKYGDINDALTVEMDLWKKRGLHPEYVTVY
ncbi:MAG: D-alanyl-D-alanine carboxypeptidase, partial [Muribaculaceae bacterium]|nr:D-alanyl-D-alanine carboxypeptidase [Muribaculaceae bacterium]